MIGSYRPITAPALVIVGTMMMRNATKIDWGNYAESLPALLIVAGIPLSFTIADGLALGFIAYPVIKLLSGQGRDVKWLMYLMAVLLIAYFVVVRVRSGNLFARSAQRASGRSGRGMQNAKCKSEMQHAAVSQYKPASHFTIYNLHFAFCFLR